MVRAIFSSDLSEVSRVLEDDPDECHLLDGDKRGALHAAAFVGDADVVEAVITCATGASPLRPVLPWGTRPTFSTC